MECGANQTMADLNAGNYNVNVQMYTENWEPICKKDFAVNVGDGSGDPSCDDVQVAGSNEQIQIDGLTAPVEIVQVFDEDWNLLFRCSGMECGANQTMADLNAGNYNVNVQMYTENWEPICKKDFAVNVGDGSGDPSCDDVQVTESNGQIQIDGLTAPIEVVRIFDMDNNWMQVFECNNDCGTAQTISNLSSNNYAVKVQMHNENWSWICESNTIISLDTSANNRLVTADILELITYTNQQTVKLNWITGLLPKTNYFIVERAVNDSNFEAIAEITLSSDDDYYFSWTDRDAQLGDNHYRIKQVLKSGGERLSVVRTEQFFLDATQINVFPNPAQGALTIQTTALKGYTGSLEVYNLYGQLIESWNNHVFETNYQTLDVGKYENGLYLLSIKVKQLPIINKRFVKEDFK